MSKRMLSPNAPAAKWLFNFSALWLYCSENSVLLLGQKKNMCVYGLASDPMNFYTEFG
jgi:hypothetical protein